MNAERELLRAYREWHRLAEAETKAIQTRNWRLLADCHLAIRDYQTLAASLTHQAKVEWQAAGLNLEEKKRAPQVLVASLIELTRRNHSRLQQILASGREKLDRLGQAGKNLKRLQRSYGFANRHSRVAA